MSAEQLLCTLGGIRDDFIREAAPGTAAPRRRRWPWAAAAACLCLVLLAAGVWLSPVHIEGGGGDASSDAPPSLTVDGVTYVVSSYVEISTECPEGFTYAGETAVTDWDAPLPYYTSPERPEWVYVYQECWDQRKQEPYMAYVRYVKEALWGLKLVRYRREVYIALMDADHLSYQTEVDPGDQARYDAVPYGTVLRELPQGFEPVGRTVFDGHDLVPVSELGSNYLPGQQVLANPAEPDILLLSYYWSGLEGPEYWVFVRC